MDNNHFLSPIIPLKEILPEAAWRRVLLALRQDSLVWSALGEVHFLNEAIDRLGGNPDRWSPGELAILAIGGAFSAAELRNTPHQALDSQLRQEADLAFATNFQTVNPQTTGNHIRSRLGSDPVEGMKIAGLVALSMREAHRTLGSWTTMGGSWKVSSAETYQSAVACLYAYTSEPLELLLGILAGGDLEVTIQLILHALLSNPDLAEKQVDFLEAISKEIPPSQGHLLLRRLEAIRPDLAADLAGTFTISQRYQVPHESSDPLQRLESLLQRSEYERIALHSEEAISSLDQAWSIGQTLQSQLAANLAKNAARINDLDRAILGWQRAAQAAPSPDGFLAWLVLTKIRSGDLKDIQGILPDKSEHPAVIFARARLAQIEGSDLLTVRRLALKAFDLASREKSRHGTHGLDEFYPDIAKLFLAINLPLEACQVTRWAICRHPNNADLFALLGKSHNEAGRYNQAVQAFHLAVALEPGRLELREQLARSLENKGDWSSALGERTTILERVATPASEEMRALANTALRAGELQLAVDICQQALDADQRDGFFYALMGEALLGLNDTEQAMAHFHTATRLAPQDAAPWLALARAQFDTGQREKAMETLRAASHAVPESAETHLALAQAYLSEDALTQAVAALQQAAGLAPKDPLIAQQLGATLLDLGRLSEAHHVLDQAYQLLPQNVQLAHTYARVLLVEGDNRGALCALIPVVQSEPDSASVFVDYAQALLSLEEQPEEVVKALRKALKLDPEDLIAQAMLADALALQGDLPSAMQQYQMVLDGSLAADPRWHTRLTLGLGRVALRLGQVETALAAFKDALPDNEENPVVFQCLSEAYLLADLPEDALQTAREALRLGPDQLDTLTWFAEQAVQLRAQAEALTVLKRAIELAPQRTDLMVILAQTQIKLGDNPSAWETANRIIEADNATAKDLGEASQCYLAMNDLKHAIRALELALQKSPQPSIDLLLDLVETYRRAEQPDMALERLEQAIAGHGDDSYLQIQKALILQDLDRPQAAIGCLQHALNLSPEDPVVRCAAAEMLRRDGDLDGALQHAEEWIRLEPHNLAARHFAGDIARARLQPDYAMRLLRDGWPLEGASPSPDAREGSRLQPESDALAYYCLYAELSLDAGEEIGAAEALHNAALLAPEDPRLKALQARMAARRGDSENAKYILTELYEKLSESVLAGSSPEDIRRPALDASVSLSMADAAIEVGMWEKAIETYQQVVRVVPLEPYPHLKYARAIVIRAETASLASQVDVVRHSPGLQSLSEQAWQSFYQAIECASQYSQADPQSPQIVRWRGRGKAIFSPGPLTAQTLASLPDQPDDTAARIHALRQTGDLGTIINAARPYPHHPRVMAHLALALRDHNPHEALPAARIAVDQAPGEPLYHALLAKVALQAGVLDQARKAIDTALGFWPDEAGWHAIAADIYLADDGESGLDSLQYAISHLEQAAQLRPRDGLLQLKLGQAYLEAGDPKRAIPILDIACKLLPGQVEPWIARALAYQLEGELERAAGDAERAIEIDSRHVAARLLRAEIAMQAGEPRVALLHSQEALQEKPGDPTIFHLQARALNAMNRPAEALATLEKAIPHVSKPLPLLLERAHLIRKTQGQDAALAALNELNAGFPEEPSVLALQSRVLAEAGKTEEAIRTAKRALNKGRHILNHSDLAYLHHLLGRLMRQAGQLDQAIHHLSEAILASPHASEPYIELGRAYLDRREYQQALHVFQKAIEASPDDPRPYYQAGLALKECKDYQKAETMLRRAAELDPNDLSIHRQLGAVVALNIVHNNREATINA